jgi:hypothetical protein
MDLPQVKREVNAVACEACGAATEAFEIASKKGAREYFRCLACGFTRLSPRFKLSQGEEKKRYLLHRNALSDKGYADFLAVFLEKAIKPFARPGARILDFGSGPEPALSAILEESGYPCDRYDPFFARTRLWKTRSYDLIALHEVVEHLWQPAEVFKRLIPRLAPGGAISIRTRFLPARPEDFASWWYRMDPTHVSFFTIDSLFAFFSPQGLAASKISPPDIAVFRN